jgi:hypothetical protein
MKMRQKFIATFIILILPAMGMTQKPLDHKKRIYNSPEGKIYIQKSLPVYLRIATSPDEDAESYLLKSEETSEYSNPMYFDTEGWNTVRSPSAVDTSNKQIVYPLQDIIFEVYADSKPPRSNAQMPEAGWRANGKKYYGREVEVQLAGKDALSGLEQIYYSLNGEAYKPYKNSISCKAEKEYQLRYYSIDHVHNVEKPKMVRFVIDKTSPTTSYSIEGDNKNNILGTDASIRLTSKDSLSGIKEIRYSINGKAEEVYREPISVKNFAENNNELVYYAIDHVGNKEKKQSLSSSVEKKGGSDNGNDGFSFYIDRDAPETEIRIKGDRYEGKHLFVSERSKVEILARDDKSGVRQVTYSINNSSLGNMYEGPFHLEEAGLQYINFSAEDQVKNISPRKTKAVFMDTGNPRSEIQFVGKNYKSRDTIFVRNTTKLKISGKDGESGMKQILYKIDGGDHVSFKQPFGIEEDGLHQVHYHAVDQVNNHEEDHKVKVYLDQEAPEIYHHFSVKAIGTKKIREEQYTIYPSNCRLYVAATDMACGTEKLKYRVNEGEWKTRIPVPQLEPGNYEVEIQSTDYLGNEDSTTVKFAIEH